MQLNKIIFIFLFFQHLVIAQASASASEFKTGSVQNSNGFLFEVKKNNKISYIFGTIHTGFSDKQLLGRDVAELVKKSKKVYVEADISDSDKSAITIEKNGFFKERKLAELMSPSNFSLYKSILVDRGNFFSIDEYETAKPWLVAMLVPIADSLRDPYPLLKYGSDIQIISIAKENGIQLSELEGIEYQASFFSDMNDKDSYAYFSSYVDLVQHGVIYKRIAGEIDFWTTSNFDAFEDLLLHARELNDFYSVFYFKNVIDRRNSNFAVNIASAMDGDDGAFFAIGCEHLAGESGVLNRLSKIGYKIKKINKN